ncbi:MAG: DNA-directed RNA polymerase subunit beta' [Patescibacteria group bacterium]|nr:DNA-directed RNA polymerase subunit beta' [Patescibacteria group bacterium]
MITQNKRRVATPDFNAISLKLASPDRIKEWSYGEVTKPETINYRTGRSERGGLFDERIFGPERDYECYCGKYRRIRYKDIVCERCGVEVTHSIVRRERMGHIELACPVAHIWFLRTMPSRISLFLNLSAADLEKVVYFAGYILTKVNEEEKAKMLKEIDGEYKQRLRNLQDDRSKEALKETMLAAKKSLEALSPGKVLDEVSYHRLSLKYGSVFEAAIGAEAIYDIFRRADLNKLLDEVATDLEKASSLERPRIQKRYNLIRAMRRSGVRPEWMFLTVLPIIPPDLRPMVALDGGRHATSDINDLYRRVINRNNRLKKLQELKAPEVILRNEKRILQEAVDALIDNSIRRSGSGAMSQTQRRPLKSLSDGLKGKQGRFRQHLLGKRVDYSGRSVIVVGPNLKLSECGLPKDIALELFRPFVISRILLNELAYNIRGASRLINDREPEVWAILEEVIKDKYVLLNRAPTLHRLGIQAFRPILIEGNAIRVHPLVCAAFNADFDGDQMAVHVPLSTAAQKEAHELLAANHNILKPGNGQPIVNPKLDIILGCFWMTKFRPGALGENNVFTSAEEAIIAFHFDQVDMRAKIKVGIDDSPKFAGIEGDAIETSIGRVLFNRALPVDFPFVNQELTGKEISALAEELIVRYGAENIADILDQIKNFGFKYATRSGTTWGMDEVVVPEEKKVIVAEALKEAESLEDKYNAGLLSKDEKYRLTIKVWNTVKSKIEKILLDTLEPESSIGFMLTSGARGSVSQVSQMSGMKGLIINPAGRLIEFPIIPSYKEGLSPLEYFITTHGSRKTLTDTALNTAKAGYLTRRLVYVAEEIIITEKDCGDTEGKLVSTAQVSSFDRGLGKLIQGRFLARDLKDADGKIVLKKGKLISPTDVAAAEKQGATEAQIRSLLSCKTGHGVCQTCYGLDLGRGRLVKIGESVGIVAAQAIGEPGTQLTMRTKHTGGVDVGGDIVGGLPRVEEIFERRLPKNAAIVCSVNGVVSEVQATSTEKTIVVLGDSDTKLTKTKTKTKTTDGQSVEYKVPSGRDILVKEGEAVIAGQLLTSGSADLQELFKYAGKDVTEAYIISEITKIYELQGAFISRKHLEVIIRQMFSRRRIKQPGDTAFEPGEMVGAAPFAEANEQVRTAKTGQEAIADTVLLGISEVSLTNPSFISAVSFGQSTRVLIKTAVRGGLDDLRGLKENVIVGRLIPAGTGLVPDYEPKQEVPTEPSPMVKEVELAE